MTISESLQLGTAAGTAVVVVMQYLASRKRDKMELKIDEVKVVAQKTEALVNNQSGVVKRALVVSTALNYKLQESEENRLLAEDARKSLEEHNRNQVTADKIN